MTDQPAPTSIMHHCKGPIMFSFHGTYLTDCGDQVPLDQCTIYALLVTCPDCIHVMEPWPHDDQPTA